ncbi:MAG: hypothetical protein WD335_02715 [Candidatus Paceibacterota bacterium]
MSKNTTSQIPQWVADWSLIIGLVVLSVSFVNYGMSFLYPSPEYGDFCGHDQYQMAPVEIDTESACVAAGGGWNEDVVPRRIDQTTSTATPAVTGYCDRDYTCRQSYDAASDVHDRNGLLAMLMIGLFVAVFGFLRRENDILASAASISGVIIILSGLIRYWSLSNDWAQFILLGSILLVFVYLAVLRSKD